MSETEGKPLTREGESHPSIQVPLPVPNGDLFSRKATGDVLTFLATHPHEAFPAGQLADILDFNAETTRRAIDLLADNDLVIVEDGGRSRPVQINRDRLTLPTDPIVRIPQEEFHDPVRVAVAALTERLEHVVAILLYGSVARGEADRLSDIDLWVLVDEDRAGELRRARVVTDDLEQRRFNGDRYSYHVAVESTATVPNFTRDIQAVVASGFPVYHTDSYDTIERHLRNLARDG